MEVGARVKREARREKKRGMWANDQSGSPTDLKVPSGSGNLTSKLLLHNLTQVQNFVAAE